MLAIVNADLGNIGSVRNMVEHLGYTAELRPSPDGLTESDAYILPGVGAFDEGVRRLHDSGWFEHLTSLPAHTHVLGICLGMQLLGQSSEEGTAQGLGRVPATFLRFPAGVRVPHMGWNAVTPVGDDILFDPSQDHRFYFTHSFYASVTDPDVIVATASYPDPFPVSLRSGNTRGVQFHPEKSHRFGKALLSRWLEVACSNPD